MPQVPDSLLLIYSNISCSESRTWKVGNYLRDELTAANSNLKELSCKLLHRKYFRSGTIRHKNQSDSCGS
jgi:hypothetical protein